MKISELPEPYKSLANARRDNDSISQETDFVDLAFLWSETKEGKAFWGAVANALTKSELPPIPTHEANLLSSCKWLVAQLQGDSGTGHSHLDQFPEYRAALAAIEKAESKS